MFFELLPNIHMFRTYWDNFAYQDKKLVSAQ